MSKISSPLRRSKRRSPLRHDEGTGHMMMTREAHIEEHDGDAVAAGYEVETKIEDVTTEVEDKTTEFEKFQKYRVADIPPLSVETIGELKKPEHKKETYVEKKKRNFPNHVVSLDNGFIFDTENDNLSSVYFTDEDENIGMIPSGSTISSKRSGKRQVLGREEDMYV